MYPHLSILMAKASFDNFSIFALPGKSWTFLITCLTFLVWLLSAVPFCMARDQQERFSDTTLLRHYRSDLDGLDFALWAINSLGLGSVNPDDFMHSPQTVTIQFSWAVISRQGESHAHNCRFLISLRTNSLCFLLLSYIGKAPWHRSEAWGWGQPWLQE